MFPPPRLEKVFPMRASLLKAVFLSTLLASLPQSVSAQYIARGGSRGGRGSTQILQKLMQARQQQIQAMQQAAQQQSAAAAQHKQEMMAKRKENLEALKERHARERETAKKLASDSKARNETAGPASETASKPTRKPQDKPKSSK